MSATSVAGRVRGKGGLIALAVLALLSAWLFFDMRKRPAEPDMEPRIGDLLGIDAAGTRRVDLKRGEESFSLRREGDSWTFDRPKSMGANPDSVKSWLQGLLDDARISRPVEGDAGGDAALGLDKPIVTLTVSAGNGQERVLQVGKAFQIPGDTGPPANYYARIRPGDRVVLLSSAQVDDLKNKKVDDLRDRRIAIVKDEKEIRSIILRRPSGTIRLEKQGDDWKILEPIRAPGDDFSIPDLVSAIRNTEGEAVIDAAPTERGRYEMDKPLLTLETATAAGPLRLDFGQDRSDGRIYVARAGGELLRLAKLDWDKFNKQVAELRDRQLLNLARDKVTAFELVNSHGSVLVRKRGSDWMVERGVTGAPLKADQTRFDTLYGSVTGNATGYVEERASDPARYGLDKPAMRFTLNPGAPDAQVLEIGKKSKEGYYARALGGPVFEVAEYIYTDLNLRPDAFKPAEEKKKSP